MKTPKTALALTVLASSLALGGAACRPHHGGHGFARAVEALDLSEAQEDQALDIGKALHAEGRVARKQLIARMPSLIAEIGKPAPDVKRVHGLVDETLADLSKLAHGAVDRMVGFHSTLDETQRAEAVKRLTKLHDRVEGWE